MTTPNELRLLPWSGSGDKPCYLSTDDPDGYMSRLADSIEVVQLGTASELLEEVSEALDDKDTSLDEMRCLVDELTRGSAGRLSHRNEPRSPPSNERST